jgi:hypothetical protein
MTAGLSLSVGYGDASTRLCCMSLVIPSMSTHQGVIYFYQYPNHHSQPSVFLTPACSYNRGLLGKREGISKRGSRKGSRGLTKAYYMQA